MQGLIAVRSTAGIGVDLAFLPEPGMLSGLLRRGGSPPEKHAVRGGFLKQEGEAWVPLADTPRLEGNWDRGLFSLPSDAPVTPDAPRTPIWTVVPRAATPNRHDMADFALRLNELTPELDKVRRGRRKRRDREHRARARCVFFSFLPSHALFSCTLPPPIGPPPDGLPTPPGHARPGGRPV